MVAERFQDERLRRLFSFQAMYAGLPPSRALAIYAVITYMDSVAGVYFPEGGMGAIPVAWPRAAEIGGVQFRWGATVQEIQRGPNGRVAAVDLGGGERLRADAVVCTLDTPVAYERLLPGVRGPRAVRSGRYSPSAVVWHVGVNGAPPAAAAHHNIHFAHEWDSAFDALIGERRLMPDPSRLVTVPSLTDPSLAAPGGSTLYVLEPVPHLGGSVDWNRERGPMRERLMGFLTAHGYPTDVVTEELVTPLEWQAMGMASGTPFALAHTFVQTGPFRPPNVERKMPGLVFAGSGTVPGRGRADGPHQRAAGGGAGARLPARAGPSAGGGVVTQTPCMGTCWRRATAEPRGSRETTARPTTGAPCCCRPSGAGTSTPSTRCAAWPTTSSTATGRADPADERVGSRPPRPRRAFADDVPRASWRRTGTGRDEPVLAAVGDSVRPLRDRPENVDRFFGAMAQDLTTTTYETWDDLVAYMEGSAAVIGEMMLPVLRPRSARRSSRPGRWGWRSS